MVALREPNPVRRPPRSVPSYLIHEIMDGKPLYYKGYREVVSGKKTFEEIMGASSLQSLIVSYFSRFIFTFLDDDQYFVFMSEAGLHIDHRNNLSNDIAIYDQTVLTPEKISRKYADVPPKIVIEIDIDADVADMGEYGYIYKKTQKMLNFGTEKVFWILTSAQVVIVATPEKIETFRWHTTIELFDNQYFNIGEYLDKKGIIVK